MASICFFASHFKGNKIPGYVAVYLDELKRHFSEVVLLTEIEKLSRETKQGLLVKGITLFHTANRGYDFGRWHTALKKWAIGNYDVVALVNDSCILFKPLDEFMNWSRSVQAHVLGITFSEAVAPHVQSYFMLFRKPALAPMLHYFEKHGIYENIHDVINNYEIGLSVYLASLDIKPVAFVDNGGYAGEFSPYYYCLAHHLAQGAPLIKKKIIFRSYRRDELFTLARMNFKLSPKYYTGMVKKYNNVLLVDFEKLINENKWGMSVAAVFKYNFTRLALKLGRPLYRLFKQKA